MSAHVGYSGNQRRVLAELGLATMRPRVAAGEATRGRLLLPPGGADDALLAAILRWMPEGTAIGEDGYLPLPEHGADDLGAVLDLAGLRRHPERKRQLWQRQRRLRRDRGR